MSLGGTSFAIRSSSYVNHSNPASYTAFDTTSFLFEGGFYTESTTLKTLSLSQKSSFSSIGSVLFGFPVTRRIKASFGLIPYSSVGYKIAEQKSLVVSPDSSNIVSNLYDGSGGLNKAYLGFGYYISHNLSLGVNADFLFGTIRHNSLSSFPELFYAQSYRQTTLIKISDFNFNFGLQYIAELGKNKHLTLGFVYTPSMNVKASNDTLAVMVDPSDPETILYQISQTSLTNGKIKMPKSIGGGFAFEKDNKLMIAGDIYWQNWEKFNLFGKGDSLKNSLRASIGVQLIPNATDFNNYFKRVRYRFGIAVNNTYLQINKKQLSDFGVSFGVGLPLRKSQTDLSKGIINFGIEIGKRGTTDMNLIKEDYVRFTMSLAIYDIWFRKQKYY